ncbi:hypothetical protein OIU84_023337 [Salix udensis]|uniref:Uncharacterized protein n=1 Tax=Salix udensis TaxID=889485 RepID=A0AAD6KQL5_9ROSI|nr:hypothetical protein OIU84_023337 [Salix udensis]
MRCPNVVFLPFVRTKTRYGKIKEETCWKVGRAGYISMGIELVAWFLRFLFILASVLIVLERPSYRGVGVVVLALCKTWSKPVQEGSSHSKAIIFSEIYGTHKIPQIVRSHFSRSPPQEPSCSSHPSLKSPLPSSPLKRFSYSQLTEWIHASLSSLCSVSHLPAATFSLPSTSASRPFAPAASSMPSLTTIKPKSELDGWAKTLPPRSSFVESDNGPDSTLLSCVGSSIGSLSTH